MIPQRTTCGIIYNDSSVGFQASFLYVWVEPLGTHWEWVDKSVAAGGNDTFDCGAVFWECHDVREIMAKACRFRSVWPQPDGTLHIRNAMYMFQDHEGLIKWTRMDDPRYEGRDSSGMLNERCGCIEVTITQGGGPPPTEDMHRFPFLLSATKVY